MNFHFVFLRVGVFRAVARRAFKANLRRPPVDLPDVLLNGRFCRLNGRPSRHVRLASRESFCKNPVTMRDEWKQFWARWVSHLWRLPFGLVIALVFFLIAFPEWRRSGKTMIGLWITAVYGLVIPAVVALCFGLAYAARLQISLKTGREFKVSLPINILINFVGLVMGLWLAMWINHAAFGVPMAGENFLGSMVFGGMIIVGFSFYFAYKQAKEEALALRAEAAEARYHALENQMRPHFLFNALNSLAELIESGREDAAETTYKLSDLYRRILANSGMKTARLDFEIEIVRSYLELEQLRFGSRLSFDIKEPENSDEIFLPSLTLQTLVENAVKHGIAPSIEGGRIEIAISQQSDKLYRLSVTNTGTPYQPQVAANGTGLANTRARLNLLYGHRHQFKIECDDQRRTIASFNFTGEKID
jgi:hypothetical protein